MTIDTVNDSLRNIDPSRWGDPLLAVQFGVECRVECGCILTLYFFTSLKKLAFGCRLAILGVNAGPLQFLQLPMPDLNNWVMDAFAIKMPTF